MLGDWGAEILDFSENTGVFGTKCHEMDIWYHFFCLSLVPIILFSYFGTIRRKLLGTQVVLNQA